MITSVTSARNVTKGRGGANDECGSVVSRTSGKGEGSERYALHRNYHQGGLKSE